jgi:hypothetical protein
VRCPEGPARADVSTRFRSQHDLAPSLVGGHLGNPASTGRLFLDPPDGLKTGSLEPVHKLWRQLADFVV